MDSYGTMRVALLSYTFAEYTISLASALTDFVDVLLLIDEADAHTYSKLINPSVQLYKFKRPKLRQPLAQIQAMIKLIQKLHAFQPDIIHIQQGHLWFNFGFPFLPDSSLVLTVHDPKWHLGDKESSKTPQWIISWGFHQADHLIVHANQQCDILKKLYNKLINSIHVIPHIALGNEQASSEITVEPYTILFFGRIWEYKGLEYLIKAQPLISNHIPAANIIIAGKGEDFRRYQNMIEKPEAFEIHNYFISDQEAYRLFRRASVVVLPYIDATISGVIPLAYQFGCPVVVTRVGGLPEMVDDGRTGYIVPPHDEKALAQALIRILENENHRNELGSYAKQKLKNEWSPQVCAQKTFAVYEEAYQTSRP
jgi:glycosyltransferase involved in cell wall biosynthesis